MNSSNPATRTLNQRIAGHFAAMRQTDLAMDALEKRINANRKAISEFMKGLNDES